MRIIFFVLLTVVGLNGCEKDKDNGNFVIEGKVINIGSKEPIDSVLVILHGGNPLSNPFMPGFNNNPPDGNNDTAYTDINGWFKLEVHNESAAFIGWRKEGYNSGNIEGGNKFFNPGTKEVLIELEAICSFYPVFKKMNKNHADDTLSLYISSYEYPESFIFYKNFYGKSPFRLENDFGYCTGDTYFHYKLKYTDNYIWNEKIDSIYVKSFENYTDTIYY